MMTSSRKEINGEPSADGGSRGGAAALCAWQPRAALLNASVGEKERRAPRPGGGTGPGQLERREAGRRR